MVFNSINLIHVIDTINNSINLMIEMDTINQ